MNLSREDDSSWLLLLKEKASIDNLLDKIHQDLSVEFDEIIVEQYGM